MKAIFLTALMILMIASAFANDQLQSLVDCENADAKLAILNCQGQSTDPCTGFDTKKYPYVVMVEWKSSSEMPIIPVAAKRENSKEVTTYSTDIAGQEGNFVTFLTIHEHQNAHFDFDGMSLDFSCK